MISSIRKRPTYILYSILLALVTSCATLPNGSKNWAENTLKKLSLREKIGQMLIYRMSMRLKDIPSSKWKEIVDLIDSDGLGGVHLWYGEASSSLTIMNEMQDRSSIPILFDADIEYGLHQRFPKGTDLLPLMAIAATNDPNNAYDIGKVIAKESRAVGIHWNFSPVVDVNNNPANPIINVRSFSEDPDMVIDYGIQFMKGLQDHGMLATAKHFPGHGDTETDSHSSLAMISSDSLRLWTLEIPPFQSMINSGVDAVMVGHIHAPDYQPESDIPASMDPFWVNDILRNRLNFNGAIVTDGMGMGGITKNYSDAFALVEAVNAGCDIIIQNYDIRGSINTIEKAVMDGRISESRINESALKMLKMKEKAGLHLKHNVSLENIQNNLGHKEHRATAKRIASEAITCVKLDEAMLPLTQYQDQNLFVIDIYDSEHNHSISSITKGLMSSGLRVRPYQVDGSDSENMLSVILNEIPENSIVILNTFVNYKARKDRISLPPNELNFIKNLLKKTNKVVLGSLGNPYIIQDLPDVPVYICAYKNNSLMKQAYLDALLGKTKIDGKLPVNIPEIAKIGHGITIEMIEKKNKKLQSKPGKEIKQVIPYEVNANTENLSFLLNEAIQNKAWPGCVLLGSKDGKIFIHEASGFHTYDKKREVRESDIFDLASITKVISTTSAIMKLYDNKLLDLDDPVINYLPEFKGKQKKYFDHKSSITIKDLLTHTSGLPPFRQYFLMKGSVDARLDSIYNTEPVFNLHETMVYSDVGIIILGKIVETISKVKLDVFVQSNIFDPLGMNNTFYNPPKEKLHRIVPTEIDPKGKLIKGYVHDENAYSISGVAGHAGLFSKTKDLAIFSQMMLNKGLYGWKRIFRSETVDLFTQRSNIIQGDSRCLGWDSPSGKASGGVYLSNASYGHTGFTGTSLWIDPENDMIVILLTNAVHPDRESKTPNYFDWRQKIHSAVYESIGLTEKNPDLQWRKEW